MDFIFQNYYLAFAVGDAGKTENGYKDNTKCKGYKAYAKLKGIRKNDE
jgi:hypothetical protein